MKEKQWVHIEKKYDSIFKEFSIYYRYPTIDLELGEVNVYQFLTNTNEYNRFMDLIKEKGIKFNVFRREFTFLKKEIENAEILKLEILADAKESFSPYHKGYICNNCDKHVQYLNINELFVKYRNIKKYDICVTYMGSTEIIISEKLKQILINERITGIRFSSIYDIDTREIINDYFHLQLEEGIGEVIKPSIVSAGEKCEKCGFYDSFLCQTPLNFKRELWEGLDISYTQNWFGSPPIMQGKWLIISQKLYKVLIANKIKHINFQPSFLL